MGVVDWGTYLSYLSFIDWLTFLMGFCAFFHFHNTRNYNTSPSICVFIVLLWVIVMGAFPMLDGGADRNRYFAAAKDMQLYGEAYSNDVGYDFIVKILTMFPLEMFFYLQSLLYTLGIYIFCKSLDKKCYGLILIGMMLNFQFVSYGVNTIRAGLAGSTVLFAIANRDKKWVQFALLAFSVTIHKSFALPVACYLLALYYDRTKWYFYVWLLSIPASFLGGGFFQGLFGGMLEDERVRYLTTEAANTAYKVGFRIDFILYSCLPIALGYYYIYKRNFQDLFYKNLYNMYILANTFWILVIRANFSDRFAYLSWFIYSAVMLYPLVKKPEVVEKPLTWGAFIIAGFTAFSLYL